MDELRFLPQPVGPRPAAAGRAAPLSPTVGPSFAETLAQVPATALRISSHAKQRLQSRQIQLDAEDWARMEAGVERAAAKGGKEALLVSEKVAMVVSVRNRTVITAVEPGQLRDNVFTNIDSAVIV